MAVVHGTVGGVHPAVTRIVDLVDIVHVHRADFGGLVQLETHATGVDHARIASVNIRVVAVIVCAFGTVHHWCQTEAI